MSGCEHVFEEWPDGVGFICRLCGRAPTDRVAAFDAWNEACGRPWKDRLYVADARPNRSAPFVEGLAAAVAKAGGGR